MHGESRGRYGVVQGERVGVGGSVVPFQKKLEGGKTFDLKNSRMGGGRYLFQKNGGR